MADGNESATHDTSGCGFSSFNLNKNDSVKPPVLIVKGDQRCSAKLSCGLVGVAHRQRRGRSQVKPSAGNRVLLFWKGKKWNSKVPFKEH